MRDQPTAWTKIRWSIYGVISALVLFGGVTAFADAIRSNYDATSVKLVGDQTVAGTKIWTGPVLVAGSTSNAYINMVDGNAVAVSPASTGRLRFNATTQKLQVSENGGAYADVASGVGGSGFTDDGTVVRLTTATDTIGIGTTTPQANTKAQINADLNQTGLRVLANVGDNGSTQNIFRVEKSTGSSLFRVDARGHGVFGDGASTQDTAVLFLDKTAAGSTRNRGLRSRTVFSSAVSATTVVSAGAFEVQAEGNSTSAGTLTAGSSGIPAGGLFIGGGSYGLHQGTGAHTGDFTGHFGFAGGDAAAALGTITRANGIAGQVGYDPDATLTGTITTGAALRALSPAGIAAGRTVATATGLRVDNQGGIGVTDAIGIDILAQIGASTNNIGIRSAAIIENTSGGYKFPDGTIQITASTAASATNLVRAGITLFATPVAGEVAYMTSTAATVARAQSNSLSTSRLYGVYAGTASTLTISGVVNMFFDAGLTSITPGTPVFISATTAGRVTKTAPTTAGQVVAEVGILESGTGYDNVLGSAHPVQIQVKAPVQL